MFLEKSKLDNILSFFMKRINDLRTLFMALLLQEEQAALHISEHSSIRSMYLSERKEFVFGERYIGDRTFYTDIDISECMDQLFDIEGTLNEIVRILVLKLAAIHEDYYRALVSYFLTIKGETQIDKKVSQYEKGSPELRLIKFQELFKINGLFSSEYKELNFLFRVRNCVAHTDGIISEKYFKEYSDEQGNLSEYRKHTNKYGTKIELGEKLVLSEHDFSELIYLVESVGRCIYFTIIRESPYVENIS